MITGSLTHKLAAASPLFFRVGDVLSVVFSSYLAYFIRFEQIQLPDTYVGLIVATVFIVLASTSYKTVYESLRGQYGFRFLTKIFLSWAIAGIAVTVYLVFSKTSQEYSRLWLGSWWLLVLALMIGSRLFIYSALAYIRSKGADTKYIYVVGYKDSYEKIVNKLQRNSWSGLSVRGFFDTSKKSISSLCRDLESTSVDEIWISLPLAESHAVKEILFHLHNQTQNLRYIPDTADLRLLNHDVQQIAGINMITLNASPLNGINSLLKRFEDIVLGWLFFILSLPLILVIAAGIKLTSKGPVLFKQRRHGFGGQEINVYKFRSMVVHSELNGEVTQATKQDSRITKFGAFLRRTSLDELPQFFNVIQGKMSIVGPRPHALAHNEEYKRRVESYMTRHKVKPGITGWAQVNGFRGETDTLVKMEKRVEYDLFYIDNWSVWFDLKIIVMTVFVGFINKNAY